MGVSARCRDGGSGGKHFLLAPHVRLIALGYDGLSSPSRVQGTSFIMTKTPCSNCPWRRESDPDEWPRERWLNLVERTIDGLQAMACHKSPEDQPSPCAGFVAQVGAESIGLRLLAAKGSFLPDDYASGDPSLYANFGEMLRAKGIDPATLKTTLSESARQGLGSQSEVLCQQDELEERAKKVGALLSQLSSPLT